MGVSVDSVHSHRVFAEMHGFNMPLVSDFNKDISESYGVRVDRGTMKGICHRSIFVIDHDGKISYVWKQEPRGPLPVNDDVREAIRAVGSASNK